MNQQLKNILICSVMFLFLGNINVFSQSEDEKINRLVEQKIAYNKNNKSSIVYKIQIYNGNEKEAYKTKQTFSTLYPDYTADIVYNAPEWKTQVGKFKTRLEADKILKIIKQDYTGAIVLEDKI